MLLCRSLSFDKRVPQGVDWDLSASQVGASKPDSAFASVPNGGTLVSPAFDRHDLRVYWWWQPASMVGYLHEWSDTASFAGIEWKRGHNSVLNRNVELGPREPEKANSGHRQRGLLLPL